MKSEQQYNAKVKDYIALYASDHNAKKPTVSEEAKVENVHTNNSSDGPAKAGDARVQSEDSGDEIKEHESELSATSDIEMMEIDDDDDDQSPHLDCQD